MLPFEIYNMLSDKASLTFSYDYFVRVRMKSIILLFLLFFSVNVTSSELAEPAEEKDFIGQWKMVPIQDELQASDAGKKNWPASCQYFAFYSDNYLLHQQTELGECKNYLPNPRPKEMNTVTWKIKDGVMFIERSDFKIRETWKVDRVKKDTNLGSTKLVEGDLLMQLIHPETRQLIWVRVIHNVGNL